MAIAEISRIIIYGLGMKAKKIGLLGGSFDPIHFGHLNLALELKEKKSLDEVWLIPAQINPHKTDTQPVSFEHRFEMARLAIEGVPHFFLNDLESKRSPPSYTIDTLRLLIENDRNQGLSNQFYLLLGEDGIRYFSRWHLAEEIVRLVPLAIGSRFNPDLTSLLSHSEAIQAAIRKGLTQTRRIDISSTELRERLSKKLYCGHLMPSLVLRYIEKNGLYA